LASDHFDSRRIAELDGLRAVAIMAFIGTHGLPGLFPGGSLGVDLFFVLSGYLITAMLDSEWRAAERISFRRFARRRIFRIWPAFAALLILILVMALIGDAPEHLWSVLIAALSITNWTSVALGSDYGGLLRHSWSLSAEEQFYLLWSAAIAFGGLLAHRRALIGSLLGIIVLMTVWRIVLFSWGADSSRLFKGLDTHSEGLLLGCLLALFRPASLAPLVRRFWPAAAAVLIATLLCVQTYSPYNLTIGLAVTPIASVCPVWAALQQPRSLRALGTPLLAAIGRRSYSLYLWRWPVFQLAALAFPDLWVQLPLELAVAVGLAELSYRFVELPFLSLRARQDRRSEVPVADGVAPPA
jgi:peptidoglycan/LPS O-acetylase OafA/YrhL